MALKSQFVFVVLVALDLRVFIVILRTRVLAFDLTSIINKLKLEENMYQSNLTRMSCCCLFSLLCWIFLFNSNVVYGTHFRYAQISWKLITGTTVEFTAQIGWNAGEIDDIKINFGDGNDVRIDDVECPTGVTPCPSDSSSVIYYQFVTTTSSYFLSYLSQCFNIHILY